MNLILAETPVVFLSYDEPNADKNFAWLRQVVPHALRVHGVKGFDAAHKAAANAALEYNPDCTHLVTVDADNWIDPKFFDLVLYLGGENEEDPTAAVAGDISNCVLSWSAYNLHNGLVYGNGGLKVWPKDWILGMSTHETNQGDDKAAIDFCWEGNYIQFKNYYSYVWYGGNNQAWRAGFREGVKTATLHGDRVGRDQFWEINHIALHRLFVWATITNAPVFYPGVGRIETGGPACQGALDGIYCACIDMEFDRRVISDLDALQRDKIMKLSPEEVQRKLREYLNFDVPEFSPGQSSFVRDIVIGMPVQNKDDPMTRLK